MKSVTPDTLVEQVARQRQAPGYIRQVAVKYRIEARDLRHVAIMRQRPAHEVDLQRQMVRRQIADGLQPVQQRGVDATMAVVEPSAMNDPVPDRGNLKIPRLQYLVDLGQGRVHVRRSGRQGDSMLPVCILEP